MNNKETALLAAKMMLKKKGQDAVIIDISRKASFADFFVICSGGNERQISAIADEVEDALAAEGILVKNIEGKRNSGWILMDFGDVIVNVLTRDMREKYNIEKVWGDCEFITPEEEE